MSPGVEVGEVAGREYGTARAVFKPISVAVVEESFDLWFSRTIGLSVN